MKLLKILTTTLFATMVLCQTGYSTEPAGSAPLSGQKTVLSFGHGTTMLINPLTMMLINSLITDEIISNALDTEENRRLLDLVLDKHKDGLEKLAPGITTGKTPGEIYNKLAVYFEGHKNDPALRELIGETVEPVCASTQMIRKHKETIEELKNEIANEITKEVGKAVKLTANPERIKLNDVLLRLGWNYATIEELKNTIIKKIREEFKSSNGDDTITAAEDAMLQITDEAISEALDTDVNQRFLGLVLEQNKDALEKLEPGITTGKTPGEIYNKLAVYFERHKDDPVLEKLIVQNLRMKCASVEMVRKRKVTIERLKNEIIEDKREAVALAEKQLGSSIQKLTDTYKLYRIIHVAGNKNPIIIKKVEKILSLLREIGQKRNSMISEGVNNGDLRNIVHFIEFAGENFENLTLTQKDSFLRILEIFESFPDADVKKDYEEFKIALKAYEEAKQEFQKLSEDKAELLENRRDVQQVPQSMPESESLDNPETAEYLERQKKIKQAKQKIVEALHKSSNCDRDYDAIEEIISENPDGTEEVNEALQRLAKISWLVNFIKKKEPENRMQSVKDFVQIAKIFHRKSIEFNYYVYSIARNKLCQKYTIEYIEAQREYELLQRENLIHVLPPVAPVISEIQAKELEFLRIQNSPLDENYEVKPVVQEMLTNEMDSLSALCLPRESLSLDEDQKLEEFFKNENVRNDFETLGKIISADPSDVAKIDEIFKKLAESYLVTNLIKRFDPTNAMQSIKEFAQITFMLAQRYGNNANVLVPYFDDMRKIYDKAIAKITDGSCSELRIKD